MTDDPDIYLAEWGEAAICKGQTLQVIFDNDFAPMLGDFAEGRSITACGKTTSITALGVQHLDTITIRGANYRIDGIQPAMDGQFTDLVLSEA